MQEILVIVVALAMCIGAFLPIVIIILILKRRFQSSSTTPPPLEHHTGSTLTPREPPRDADDQWGQTKFGFDESDWGSDFNEDRDDEPRIR